MPSANNVKDPERLWVVRHEACHAVGNVRHNIRIERVWAGSVRGRCRKARGFGRIDAFRVIVCWLAGPAADRVFFDRDPDQASYSDVEKAWAMAQFYDRNNGPGVFNQAWAAAIKLVEDNRAAIEEVADRLYDNGALTGEEVAAIVRKYPTTPVVMYQRDPSSEP
jgi:hypothetical protein